MLKLLLISIFIKIGYLTKLQYFQITKTLNVYVSG